MAKFKFRKSVNVSRVVSKIVATALALWVGGKVMAAVAASMANQQTIFYEGLKFLGFSANSTNNGLSGTVDTTGVVGIIGLIGGATIILEFVQVSF